MSALLLMSLCFFHHKQAKVSSSHDAAPIRLCELLTEGTGPDIYLLQEKNLELFVQVGYDALDTGDGGISGETDPVKHREIAKKLAPAFSTRNFKAKEMTVQKYIDFFIQKMNELGGGQKGAELQRWTDWLALDLSADLTYGREMGQMRDSRYIRTRSSGWSC